MAHSAVQFWAVFMIVHHWPIWTLFYMVDNPCQFWAVLIIVNTADQNWAVQLFRLPIQSRLCSWWLTLLFQMVGSVCQIGQPGHCVTVCYCYCVVFVSVVVFLPSCQEHMNKFLFCTQAWVMLFLFSLSLWSCILICVHKHPPLQVFICIWMLFFINYAGLKK